eukprot:2023533-Pleurochrysis_carterae.AAC.1
MHSAAAGSREISVAQDDKHTYLPVFLYGMYLHVDAHSALFNAANKITVDAESLKDARIVAPFRTIEYRPEKGDLKGVRTSTTCAGDRDLGATRPVADGRGRPLSCFELRQAACACVRLIRETAARSLVARPALTFPVARPLLHAICRMIRISTTGQLHGGFFSRIALVNRQKTAGLMLAVVHVVPRVF